MRIAQGTEQNRLQLFERGALCTVGHGFRTVPFKEIYIKGVSTISSQSLVKMINLSAPSVSWVVGPSSSGKSTLCAQIILNAEQLYNQKFDNIIYCYNIYQPDFESFKHLVTFHKGVLTDFSHCTGHTLFIVDDLFPPTADLDEFFRDLHIQLSHHLKISTIILSHNCFYKNARTLSLSTHYFFFMKSPRDRRTIITFGSQVCPRNSSFFLSAYDQATEMPYSYLLCDLRQETPELMRYSSDIFNDNPAFYVPAHIYKDQPYILINHGQTEQCSAAEAVHFQR
jgi:hypothetical protein